jgi:hypothetical protein
MWIQLHISPCQVVDMRDKNSTLDGFDHVIICTHIQRAGNQPGIIENGKNHDGNTADAANFFANLPAVHLGHDQIKQDDIGIVVCSIHLHQNVP